MRKITPPFLRSDGNYDMKQASDDAGLECQDKSLTQQHLAEETDINWIVKRYQQTGEIPQHQLPPLNSDFMDGTLDFETAQNMLVAAREAFDALPSAIRGKFDNDPRKYVNFMSDEANRDEIRKMGLFSEAALAKWNEQDKAARTRQEALERDAAAFRMAKEQGLEKLGTAGLGPAKDTPKGGVS